jgi:hypothetical protein
MKFRYLSILILIGVVTFLYEQKEPDEAPLAGAMISESTNVSRTSNLIFEETFEGPTPLSTAHSTDFGADHAFRVVTSPVYRGTKSARFELRETDPLVNSGKRAEVSIIKGTSSRDRWYSFAVYFPADGFTIDSQQEIFSQWHQSADKHLGESPQSPATALRIKNDRFYLDTGYNADKVSDGVYPESRKKIDLGLVTKDTWHEFVLHFIHSYGKDGLIEVWHNGKKVITHKGGNMYNSASMPKWKIGVYKAAFKHHRSDVNKRILYFDNIRVGNQNATFDDMTPGVDTKVIK